MTFSLPCMYGPMLTKTRENKKKNIKIKDMKILKRKKECPGHMVDSYISVKFGINLLDGL